MGFLLSLAMPEKYSNQGSASAIPVPLRNFRRSKEDKLVFMAFAPTELILAETYHFSQSELRGL